MLEFDERALVLRLAPLGQRSKTAFAAACSQRLLPFYERYAESVRDPKLSRRLSAVVAAAWDVASGHERDVRALQSEAEAMVPSDEGGWTLEAGYGQNAAAAAAYAIRAWLTDDPQEAAWAARQVYELADYAALQASPKVDLNLPGAEKGVLASEIVQEALGALERALSVVEASPLSWNDLRHTEEEGGKVWASTLP